MLINAIRGHAAEFGVTAAKSLPSRKRGGRKRWRRCSSASPPPRREYRSWRARCSTWLAGQLAVLEAKLKAVEARLMAWHRQDPASRLPGDDPRRRADRRGQLHAQGARPQGLPLGPAFRRVDRHHPARELDRRASAPRQDQPARRRDPAPALGARRHRGHPTGQARAASRRGSWHCWRASRKSSRRSRWPTKWPASSGP